MTTSVINQELDSSTIEGLKLLHSKDPDSLEHLKQLWKQAVQKYGAQRDPVSILNNINIPTGLKRESGHEIGDEFAFESKKSKLDSAPTLFHKSAPASPQSGSSNVFNYIGDDFVVDERSSDEDSDSNDSPLEILNGDGVCVKCKSPSSNHNNKLVECVDCHKHYHQQCHFPPITDMDLSDPRFVWYCSACEQNITTTTSSDKNKASSSSSLSVSKSASSSKNVASSSVSKSSRSYGAQSHTSRSTISSSSSGSSNGSSSNKLSANSSPKHSSSSSGSDKKSHLMKKKPLKKHDKKKSK